MKKAFHPIYHKQYKIQNEYAAMMNPINPASNLPVTYLLSLSDASFNAIKDTFPQLNRESLVNDIRNAITDANEWRREAELELFLKPLDTE